MAESVWGVSNVIAYRNLRGQPQFEVEWKSEDGEDMITWETSDTWNTQWEVSYGGHWMEEVDVMGRMRELSNEAQRPGNSSRKR